MGGKIKTHKNGTTDVQKTVQKAEVNFGLRFPDIWQNPELVLTNMATSWWSKAGTVIPEFFLGKVPFVQMLTLLMLLAERALKLEKYPPMHPYIIYAVCGLCLISGLMMSAKIKVKYAALMYCLVLAYLTANAYLNTQFNYSRHVRNRISSRHLGCLGIFILYSFIKSERTSALMQRVGELCIATYLCAQAYLFNESYEDKKAIMDLIPGGNYARYALTVLFACAGLCFISGYFLKDISITAAFVLIILITLVDTKFWFWTYRGMSYWSQMRLITDNVNLLIGFFLCANYYENLSKEASEVVQQAQEEEEEREKQE